MKNTLRIIPENEIINLLKKQNMRGMDALYNQYSKYIYGIVCRIITCEEIAEIVLQDTFLKVWNKIETFSIKKGRFVSWIINIARNTAIDMIRSKYYKQTVMLTSLENTPITEEVIDLRKKMENLDIRDIVAGLDEKYCNIIDLIYFKGYTHSEVAEELGMPLGTVKGRVRRAFKDLRVIFSNDERIN